MSKIYEKSENMLGSMNTKPEKVGKDYQYYPKIEENEF